MEPKEKAKELVEKYVDVQNELDETTTFYWGFAKQCALIAVEEILSEYQSMSDTDSIIYIENEITYVIHKLVYWQEVKQEIEKL
jgi:hypothetical protein